jgi:hypothetical protein
MRVAVYKSAVSRDMTSAQEFEPKHHQPMSNYNIPYPHIVIPNFPPSPPNFPSLLKRQWHGIRGGGEEEMVLAVVPLPVRPGEDIYIWTAASTRCVTLWGYSP